MATDTWSQNPVIYEINTWVWLNDLSRKYGRHITLGNVPAMEWEDLAALGIDGVWLMGVWERSPRGAAIALRHEGLADEFRRALPDYGPSDVVGSPYCIRRYVADDRLGGPKGLASARAQMARRSLRLILDFVPNHVARDHPWVSGHPEYFIQGNAEDFERAPADFFEAAGKVIACGRDPFFPPWQDVAQLNAFHPGCRRAVVETVSEIASQCDGMRFYMAMLLMSSIFEKTWGGRAGERPEAEFWPHVIQAVLRKYPEFLLMAEAYWDLEWELQQQGFDLCYDKKLYDLLVHGSAESVSLHLLADLSYQRKLVRFIENHDESRAAATFPAQKLRAAAVALATLPGARLFHEGQMEGRRVKLPVQLARRPHEDPDQDLAMFTMSLLEAARRRALREGEWNLCERSGWPDNASYLNIVAWCWQKDEERYLIVVNFSDQRSQVRVQVGWPDLAGRSWRLSDVLKTAHYDRDGDEMRNPGLFVDLEPWGWHFFEVLGEWR